MRMQTQSFFKGARTGLTAEARLFALLIAAFLILRAQRTRSRESHGPGYNPGPRTHHVTSGKATWPL